MIGTAFKVNIDAIAFLKHAYIGMLWKAKMKQTK